MTRASESARTEPAGVVSSFIPPGPAKRRPGSADRASHGSLRDEARLVAAVVGAIGIDLVPGAWVVVGRASTEFVLFTALILVTWVINTTLQIATLRWARAGRFAWRQSTAAQFAWTAVAGVAFSLTFDTRLNPFTERLGLEAGNAWGSGVYAAWTSVLVALFLVWHREGRHRQVQAWLRLRSVQDAQLGARRSLVESQLQAVQARIDPQHFFDTLDATQALYRHDPPRAEALFDELVVFLRAALPSLDSASSMLAREFDLATACVRMHALATGDAITLVVEADRALQRSAFPPGLLLPLLRGILRAEAGPRRIGLSVRLETGTAGTADTAAPGASAPVLALSFSAGSAPDEATLQQARSTLRALFGAAASLRCTPPRDHCVTTHLRIDHEHL